MGTARTKRSRTTSVVANRVTAAPGDTAPAPLHAGAAHAPLADLQETSVPDTVQSVSRALSLLTCFSGDEIFLSLGALARRTGLPKPTALRLARTLASARFLVQRADGSWRLGPAAGLIGSRYQAQFDVHAVIEPVLQELAAESGESASFYIYEEDIRSCLMRAEGPHGLRHHVRLGELLPLDRGSAGKVILAALGQPGTAYDAIRKQGFSVTRGERSPHAASVSAAVMGTNGVVLGSVGISGPAVRLTVETLHGFAPQVVRAAAKLSYALSGLPATNRRSTWYPG